MDSKVSHSRLLAVAAHRDAITEFHRVCGGRVEHIHALFCAIAEHNGKPPMPSQIMAAMLDLTPVRGSGSMLLVDITEIDQVKMMSARRKI